MRATTLTRFAADALRLRRSDVRRAVADLARLAAAGRTTQHRGFARYLLTDFARYSLGRITPVEGETVDRARAAARWLARAHDATGRAGLSYGYFLSGGTTGWRAPYPETTGYTIPTLFDYAHATGGEEYRDRAVQLARWAITCQLPDGGVPGGTHPPRFLEPVAFNTGMVLHGLLVAYRETGIYAFLDGARRAAEFLLNDIDARGHFRSHGRFVFPSVIKTYTCLCAWPLYLAGEAMQDPRFCEAACKVGDAALRQQNQYGWFNNNCLSEKVHAPLLHTIAYTLQGLLELGLLSGTPRFIEAVLKAMEHLLPHCRGQFLSSRWSHDWQPAALTSCLTASAQIAVVCFRLADRMRNDRFQRVGDTILNNLKGVQVIDARHSEIHGAIGGSFPLAGPYMRFGFPQWATKFYLDALLCQETFRRREASRFNGESVPTASSDTHSIATLTISSH